MVPALRTCFGAAKYTLPVVRLEEAGIVDLAVRLKAGDVLGLGVFWSVDLASGS